MDFLKKVLLVFSFPVVLGLLLNFLEFSVLISSCLCTTTVFLWLNGPHYLHLAYKTIPRDIKFFVSFVYMFLKSKRMVKIYTHLSDSFEHNAVKHPNKTAVIFEEKKLTFKQLNLVTNKIANVLLSSTNLRRGDCVAVFMENSPEYIAIYLALSKIGVTSALINCNLRGKGLTHCIKISKCSGIIFDCSLSDGLSNILEEVDPSISQDLFSVEGYCSIKRARNLKEEMEYASSSKPPSLRNKSSKDILCYIYTSGTTGLPKPCTINHERALLLGYGFPILAGVVPSDIVYNVLPLYHTSGLLIGSGMMMVYGATMTLRKKFSARNFSSDCFKYKCTVFLYIGELCRYLVTQPFNVTDTKLRIRLFVGNGLRGDVWRNVQKRFRVPKIMEFYGATEGNIALVNFIKVGSLGYKSPFFPFLQQISLLKIHPVSGEYIKDNSGFYIEAGTNEPGELIGKITKYTPFVGYQNVAASKKKVLTDVFQKGDKYFLSGDILRADEEGFLYFCDRIGDTFRWKGENVSTTEVEDTIAQIYKSQAIVVYGVGIPGKEGRAGMAAIEGTPDSLDLSDFAKQLLDALPKYAVPIFLRFIPEAELTGTFKLKKVKLRNEGFDVRVVQDPLYLMDFSIKSYITLTKELSYKISAGFFKFN